MSTFKKVVSLIITACLILSVFPMTAFAASTTASSASALVSAFASAADGDTIVLSADITLAQTITVAKKVTLSAGGHTITRGSSFAGSLFAVTGELTLQDVTLNGNRTSTATANLASELIRVNGGKVNLKSGATLTTNRANAVSTAGGVWVEGGELNMYAGATIKDMHQHNNSGSSACYGIAVNVNKGTFNMYGGTITGNDGKVGAVGVVSGATFNFHDGEISNNIANASGNGGGAVYNAGTFNMYGGTMSGNLTWIRGGAVTNVGTFNLEGGTITNNSAAKDGADNCNGAGIYTTGTFNMTGGTISRNTAQNSAGGIMVEAGTATISGGSVINNTTTTYSGGGIFVGGGKFTMTGGIVSGNTAKQFGGGFAVTASASGAFTLSGGEVYGNNCSDTHCGSDIYITTSAGNAMTSFGNGCIRYQLYLDNSGSRYSASNAVAVTNSALTAGYGYIYVSNGAAHSFSDWEITTQSGCETTGLKERTCSVCGEREEEVVPPKGHNTISEKVDATCGSDGSITLYCPVCGYVHNVSKIPATGHIASANWTVKVPATQSSAGVKVKYCKTCDYEVETASYTYNDALIYIEASELAEKDDTTNTVTLTVNLKNNPGIWSTGFFVYYSSDLRIVSVENGGIFSGDYYVDPVYNVEVSSDKDASEIFKAAGAPTENVLYYCYYGESSSIANVTADGAYAVLTFEYSNELTGTYEIGFVYDAENIINVDGENCDILFENYQLEIAPLSACNHVAGGSVTTPAGCETTGSVVVNCAKCGRQMSKETLPAIGHTANTAWETTKAPTANAEGEKAIKCTVCGKALETKKIPALGETAIIVSDAIVTAGESADITVSIQGNPGIWGIRMFVYYSEDISLASVENGDIFADSELFESTLNINPADNFMAKEVFAAAGVNTAGLRAYCLYLEGDDIVEFTKNGVLANLKFAVPADANGEFEIGVIMTDLINTEADDVSAKIYGGQIRVVESVCNHVAGSWTVVSAGSCTANTVKEQRCILCDALLDTQITVAPGHNYNAVVTYPTCTVAGYTTYTCSVCGDSYVADETKAYGHNYETETNSPSCDADGSTVTKCTICGDTITEVLPAPGHSYKTVVTKPTCVEGGYTTYTCTVCGYSYVADRTEATGHTLGEWIVTSSATCEEDGEQINQCTICGAIADKETIPAFGHDYKAVVTPPTCNNYGYTTYTCENCGDSYAADRTEPGDHTPGEWIVTSPATCEEDGEQIKQCIHCGAIAVQETIPALGHNYDDNCDADCNVCGATREVPHSYDDCCDEECNDCGEFREAPHNLEYVPARIPADCQDQGYDEYWRCLECGAYLMDNGMGGYYEVNPAWIIYTGEHVRPEGAPECAVVSCVVCGEDSYGTELCDRGDVPTCQDAYCVNCGDYIWGEGHSYGYDEEYNPLIPFCQPGNCIYCGQYFEYLYECENGSYAPCSVDGECVYGCGKQYPATGIHELDNPCEGGLCWICWEEIEPAHSYNAVVTVPTCTAGGFTTYTCANCGDSYVGDETEATGHNFVDGTCTNCGEVEAIDGYTIYIDGVAYGTFAAGETVELPVPEMKIQNTRAYRFFTYTGAEVTRSAYNSRNNTANGRKYTLVMPEGDVELTSEYVMIGDTNLDGRINSRDTNKINQLVAATTTASSDKQAEAADVNLDGRYNSRDILNAKKIIAGGYAPSK